MRLPVPGPRDVLHLVERGAEAVDALLDAVPRAVLLLDQAEALVGRASELLGAVDATRASADAVVRRTDAVVTRAERVLTRSETLVEGAEVAVAQTAVLTGRVRELLDVTEPSLVRLQPTLERLAETTHPAEVDALVTLVDHLPLLAEQMENEIVPIMESMGSVGPDIHDLLDLTRELNGMLASVPGLGRIKRRIDEEQALEGRGRVDQDATGA
jgi:hypothetical protein